MSECTHTNIILLPRETAQRLRCRHCHLTLKVAELENGYCPECLGEKGQRRDDFEKIESENTAVRFRCEDCGVLLDPWSRTTGPLDDCESVESN